MKNSTILAIVLALLCMACSKSLPHVKFTCDPMADKDILFVKKRIAEFCKPDKVESIIICHNEKERKSRVTYKCLKRDKHD